MESSVTCGLHMSLSGSAYNKATDKSMIYLDSMPLTRTNVDHAADESCPSSIRPGMDL